MSSTAMRAAIRSSAMRARSFPDLPGDRRRGQRLSPQAPLERLDDAGELALMRQLALYPRLVEAAAGAHEPHRIAFYLYDLASEFPCAVESRKRLATFTLHYPE